jgi:molybdopterin converting factor small subunit
LAKIKVRLFFDLIPGSGSSELELEASDLSSLIESLSRRMEDAFRAPLYDSRGKPRPYSMVYHNGTAYSLKDSPNFVLKDGDIVLFVPAVGGG